MITPFRRHTKSCLYGPADKPEQGLLTRTPTLSSSHMRVWKHCKCPVWYSGSWNGKRYPRKTTGKNTWSEAERFCKSLMDGSDKGDNSEAEAIRRTIESALAEWHRECRLQIPPPAKRTMDQHELMGKRLVEFCKKRSVTRLADVTEGIVNSWREAWASERGKRKDTTIEESTIRWRLLTLKAFFDYCVDHDFLVKSPMRNIKLPPQIPITKEDTKPLDPKGGEENYIAILRELGAKRVTGHYHRPMRTPERLVAIAKLMYESGMRVIDAVLFDTREAMPGDKSVTYTYLPEKTKRNGKYCTTFFPLDLWHEIKALSPLTPGRPFYDGGSRSTHKSAIWLELQNAGNRAGVKDVHPHRFRNSFAVNKLVQGARIEDVSGWLGHSSIRTTEKYYLSWVDIRLEASRAAYERTMDLPANVVVLPRKTA